MKLAEGIYANFINKAELKLKSEQATTKLGRTRLAGLTSETEETGAKLEEIRVLKGY